MMPGKDVVLAIMFCVATAAATPGLGTVFAFAGAEQQAWKLSAGLRQFPDAWHPRGRAAPWAKGNGHELAENACSRSGGVHVRRGCRTQCKA